MRTQQAPSVAHTHRAVPHSDTHRLQADVKRRRGELAVLEIRWVVNLHQVGHVREFGVKHEEVVPEVQTLVGCSDFRRGSVTRV